jgi:hypothetical protein
MLREPFLDIAVFVGAYVVLVGLIMAVNGEVLEGRELSWIEYSAIWGLVFAPAATVTVFARVTTAPGRGDLLTQYVLALVSIGVGIEVGYVADLGPLGVVVTQAALCIFIVASFRRASKM